MTVRAATQDDVEDDTDVGVDADASDPGDEIALAARFTDRDVHRLGLGTVALFTGTALGVAFEAPVPGIALAAIGALAVASTVHALLDTPYEPGAD